MNNKKPLLLIVLFLAVATAAGTLYLRNYGSGSSMMGGVVSQIMPLRGEVVKQDAMMGVTDTGWGSASETTMMKVAPDGGFAPGVSYPYPGDDALDVVERVYQKYSYHEVVVDDVTVYSQQLREYFLSIEGRVLSTSVSSSKKYSQAYLVVKVPVAKFEEATNRVSQGVEKIVNESINAQDETGQMVSATSTLEKLQEQKSLKEIELLEATTEVARRRIQLDIDRLNRQIDQATQALEGVEGQVEYATISVSATNNERFLNPYGEPTVREEIDRAWESVQGIARLLISLVVWVVVYAVLWLPVVVLVKWVMGRVRRNRKEQEL